MGQTCSIFYLQIGDILSLPFPSSSSVLRPRHYSFCVDKGTYDAVSLDPSGAGPKRARYVRAVAELLSDRGGRLVITSCNWTEKELAEHFAERE